MGSVLPQNTRMSPMGIGGRVMFAQSTIPPYVPLVPGQPMVSYGIFNQSARNYLDNPRAVAANNHTLANRSYSPPSHPPFSSVLPPVPSNLIAPTSDPKPKSDEDPKSKLVRPKSPKI